jgi:hypothetical protein
MKLPGDEGSFRDLVRQKKQIAKSKNREFTLTDEELRILFKGNCHYCGIEPKQIWKSRTNRTNPDTESFIYNGIDRINNSKGYVPGNCVSCCRKCNSAKAQFAVSETFSDDRKWWNQQIERNPT